MSERNTRRSIISGLAWKFLERLLTQGVSFVVSLVLARILLPEDYGLLALVMSFTTISSVFINHGFASGLIQKKDADDDDFSTMFWCSQACTLLIYAVLFVAAPLVADFYDAPELTNVMRVFVLQIPLGSFGSIQAAYVSRHMMFRKNFVSTITHVAVSGVVGIIMALSGCGVWALIGQALTSSVVGMIMLWRLVPWRPKLVFSKDSAKSLMHFGSRVLGAELSSTFFNEIRGLIIGRVYSQADLAYYNKGKQIPALITNSASLSVTAVIYPALSNLGDNKEELKRLARRGIQLLCYVIAPCMFGFSAVAEPLILWLYTDKWAQMIPFAQIMSIGLCCAVLENFSFQVFKSLGMGDLLIKLEIWKKPAYVVLLVVGVMINVHALAIAIFVYDVYSMLVNFSQMKKLIQYTYREQLADIVPSLLMATLMAVVVWSIPIIGNLLLTLIVKIAAGVVVFVGGSIVLRLAPFQYLKGMLLGAMKRRA